MGDREAAAFELGEERLDVAQDRPAGRRVADVADGRGALQPLDGGAVREAVADEAELALGVEDAAVEGDDAGGFLAAVLQGVEAERDDRRGVGVAEDAEDAAFLAQGVAVEVEVFADPACRVSVGAAMNVDPSARRAVLRQAAYVGSGPLWRQPRRRSYSRVLQLRRGGIGGPPPRCGSASS